MGIGAQTRRTFLRLDPFPIMATMNSGTELSRPPLRLAVVSTHPIQYYAPVYRALAKSRCVMPRVFYTWSQTAAEPVFDPGFGRNVAWDIPLLDGYDHVFVDNTAKRPGSDHFHGIRNPALNTAIEAWHADAILVYGWNLHSHLQAMRHFKGKIPVLFRGDSTLIDPQTPLRKMARKLYLRWVYSHVDLALAVGQNSCDYFRWAGMADERITVVPHSVDTSRFHDPGGDQDRLAQRWRDELGCHPDALIIVFAAKFQAKKDPVLLLRAFMSLQSSAQLVFFGEGELESDLREISGRDPRVHFRPFQNQTTMPAVYRLGDVFVLPSCGPGETWGLAMNEAMASGRGVIASSRVGGARDLVDPGETGWIFEAGDERSLRRALTDALNLGRDGLMRLGERCKASSDRWSSDCAAAGIESAVIAAVRAFGSEGR